MSLVKTLGFGTSLEALPFINCQYARCVPATEGKAVTSPTIRRFRSSAHHCHWSSHRGAASTRQKLVAKLQPSENVARLPVWALHPRQSPK